MEHVYSIQGMHCESCATKIGQALRNVPGVSSSQVSLNPPRATVSMSRHVPVAELQSAVQRAGRFIFVPTQRADPSMSARCSSLSKYEFGFDAILSGLDFQVEGVLTRA